MAEATFLQAIGLLDYLGFQYFLIPLFVFTLLFAILQKYKIVTDKMDANAIIAFVLAMLTAMFPDLSTFLYRLLPLFVIFSIVGFSVMFFFMFFGLKQEEVITFIKKPGIVIIIFAISTIIFANVFSAQFGSAFVPGEFEPTNESAYTGTGSQVFARILAHPKVLGTVILLILLALSTYLVAHSTK